MPEKKARVVEVHSNSIITNGKIDAAEASDMLELGLAALAGGSANDILGRLFPLGQTIGIKVNTLAGRRMSTSPELVYALADIFHELGHKKDKIIIWDRSERELKSAGFKIKTDGSDYLCFATNTAGAGFSGKLYKNKSIGSMISKIQTDMTDSVVNFPVLKDHSLAGLSGCLKNYYGVIHNPNKYHENMCDPYQADLFALDVIGGKQRLAIFDAISIQYNGGPGYISQWGEEYKAVLLSTDAVALDTVAVEIVNRLRTKRGLTGLKESGREPVGVRSAGKAGLGCADLDDIEWIITGD